MVQADQILPGDIVFFTNHPKGIALALIVARSLDLKARIKITFFMDGAVWHRWYPLNWRVDVQARLQ